MHKVILIDAPRRQRACELVLKAPAGFVMSIAEPKRTNEQNDKMWAMLGEVSTAKPDGRHWTPQQWKAAFMDGCGHQPVYQESLEGGGFICTGYKSSRLKVAEMSDLIESIYEYCARKGVQLSM